jgi:hypothetical protein
MLKENGFLIEKEFKTTWKNDVHREVLFLKAVKE